MLCSRGLKVVAVGMSRRPNADKFGGEYGLSAIPCYSPEVDFLEPEIVNLGCSGRILECFFLIREAGGPLKSSLFLTANFTPLTVKMFFVRLLDQSRGVFRDCLSDATLRSSFYSDRNYLVKNPDGLSISSSEEPRWIVNSHRSDESISR